MMLLPGRRPAGLLIRAELFEPGLQVVATPEQYNQLFTMHGLIMLLLFATPAFAGWANAIMPLQIGAPDVAFPRLNMLAYWMYLFGGLMPPRRASSPPAARRPSAGSCTRRCRTPPTPRGSAPTWSSSASRSAASARSSVPSTSSRRSSCMRAPGMTMFRMPIFTWNILITSVLVLMAFPAAGRRACSALGADGGSAPTSSSPRTAARSCGSTCSGSSATPRCTSWRCRSSASSPRSCRCSAASRSSVTRAWSSRPSRSPACRSRSGRTTCT